MRSNEDGFTLIEVVVAIMVIALIMGATVELMTTGFKSSLANTRQVEALSLAQQQIEQIRQSFRQSGFSAIAINGSVSSYTPRDTTPPANPTTPNDYVQPSAGTFNVMPNYHDSTGAPLASETLLFDTTNGRISPVSTGVAAGNATATVWRYVTQRTETCNTALPGGCTNDSKRVIVAVLLDNPSGTKNLGLNTPLYLSTVIDQQQPTDSIAAGNGLRIGVQIQ